MSSLRQTSRKTIFALGEGSVSNSLFRNILQIKYLESIFCGDKTDICSANSNNVNILQEPIEKNQLGVSRSNPLFCNILRIKSCESIFYRAKPGYQPPSYLRINILRGSAGEG